ncbi:Hypp1765 [Branchiostoma lanceolatum]|uniref:ribonuclease H n=1 Tax=Branchiostoma lanceolatum TaxID=7740 RepID=A0A8J9ZN68_BRALA|nr:Hypp1765 [Branchiostoma lanceolatum]
MDHDFVCNFPSPCDAPSSPDSVVSFSFPSARLLPSNGSDTIHAVSRALPTDSSCIFTDRLGDRSFLPLDRSGQDSDTVFSSNIPPLDCHSNGSDTIHVVSRAITTDSLCIFTDRLGDGSFLPLDRSGQDSDIVFSSNISTHDCPSDSQALSLEARSPPAGLRTILDAPSQHGLRIVSPVPDAPAHTGLRVVSGASAHAAARTSPTMSAPAGSVNACRLHDIVLSSGQYNHRGLRVPVPSNLAIPVWRSALANYPDKVVCDFLEFGWPVGYDKPTPPRPVSRNHRSALEYAAHVAAFLDKETRSGATHGPFDAPPLTVPLMTSPLQTVPKRDSDSRRVVVDLSFPPGSSVNDGIPSREYLGDPFLLTLPSYAAFEDLLRQKGPGCLLFKRDLARAYRQIPVDPHDYHLLGYTWEGKFYFDSSLPFGLRSAAMACQRTTNAVSFLFAEQGFSCTNYIDDFGGADTPDKADLAFETLGQTFRSLGLAESEDKASPPAPQMTFLGVEYDSVAMSKRVPPDRLADALTILREWSSKTRATKQQIQSLVGRLSFITACVAPGRVFLSRMLNALRGLRRHHHRVRLNSEFRKDIRWWLHFLPQYNGVSLIPDPTRRRLATQPTTDACLTGCGGTFGSEFFHTPFPPDVLRRAHPIHRLEMLAVIIACKLWGSSWSGCSVNIACDNTLTVQVIHSGRSSDTFMQACARELVYLQALKDFHLVAHHIPGDENRLADLLSRWHLSPQSAARSLAAVGPGLSRERTVLQADFSFSHPW